MSSPTMDYLQSALHSVTHHCGEEGREIAIKESHPDAKLKEVCILVDGFKHPWFAFSPDTLSQGSMSPLLARGKDYNKACDEVICIELEDKLAIIYIELKSSVEGNKAKQTFKQQFKSTRQFMRYLLGLVREFNGIEWREGVEELYIVFHTLSVRKTTTSSFKESSPKTPWLIGVSPSHKDSRGRKQSVHKLLGNKHRFQRSSY